MSLVEGWGQGQVDTRKEGLDIIMSAETESTGGNMVTCPYSRYWSIRGIEGKSTLASRILFLGSGCNMTGIDFTKQNPSACDSRGI